MVWLYVDVYLGGTEPDKVNAGLLFIRRLVPESPRWLVSKGRVSEAMVTMRRVAKVNRNPLPLSVAVKLEESSGQTQLEPAVSPLVIFTRPVLFVRFLIIVFSWWVREWGTEEEGWRKWCVCE